MQQQQKKTRRMDGDSRHYEGTSIASVPISQVGAIITDACVDVTLNGGAGVQHPDSQT